MNPRQEIIEEALRLINGDRADTYGPPEKNFQRIAELWSPILGREISAVEVGLCLIQLKVARSVTSPQHRDNFVDLVGYSALTGEIAGRQLTKEGSGDSVET